MNWTGGNGDFVIIRRNGGWRARVDSGTQFDDLRSDHSQTYTYTVEYRIGNQSSARTNCGTISTPPPGFSWNPPTPPASCSVTRLANGSVQVTWASSTSADFYTVRRNGGWTGRTNAPGTSYTDNRVAAGQTYVYEVESRSDQGISGTRSCGTINT